MDLCSVSSSGLFGALYVLKVLSTQRIGCLTLFCLYPPRLKKKLNIILLVFNTLTADGEYTRKRTSALTAEDEYTRKQPRGEKQLPLECLLIIFLIFMLIRRRRDGKIHFLMKFYTTIFSLILQVM